MSSENNQLIDDYLKNIICAIKAPELSNTPWIKISKNYVIKNNNVLYYNLNLNNCPKLVVALTT